MHLVARLVRAKKSFLSLYVAVHFRVPGTSIDRIQKFMGRKLLPDCYFGTLVPMNNKDSHLEIERVQTGVRLEKRMLKVLKAVAELKDMSLGDLLEGIVLHAFEGKAPFSPDTLREIDRFRKIYGLALKASDSHKLKERGK
jgi:hypothetical protein